MTPYLLTVRHNGASLFGRKPSKWLGLMLHLTLGSLAIYGCYSPSIIIYTFALVLVTGIILGQVLANRHFWQDIAAPREAVQTVRRNIMLATIICNGAVASLFLIAFLYVRLGVVEGVCLYLAELSVLHGVTTASAVASVQ